MGTALSRPGYALKLNSGRHGHRPVHACAPRRSARRPPGTLTRQATPSPSWTGTTVTAGATPDKLSGHPKHRGTRSPGGKTRFDCPVAKASLLWLTAMWPAITQSAEPPPLSFAVLVADDHRVWKPRAHLKLWQRLRVTTLYAIWNASKLARGGQPQTAAGIAAFVMHRLTKAIRQDWCRVQAEQGGGLPALTAGQITSEWLRGRSVLMSRQQGVLMCDLAENIIRAPKVLKLLPRHKDRPAPVIACVLCASGASLGVCCVFRVCALNPLNWHLLLMVVACVLCQRRAP